MNNFQTKFIIPIIIFFTSFFLILTELLTTRIFSLLMWYHFAFVAISIALIGLGGAGLYVYLFIDINKVNIKKIIIKKLISTGIIIFLVYLIIFNIQILIKNDIKSILKLAIVYFLLILPFFFGGQILIIIYRFFRDKISLFYFFDLIGASSGCLLFIIFINNIIPPNLILIITISFLILAALLLNKKVAVPVFIILIISIPVLMGLNIKFNFFNIKYVKGHKEYDLLYEKWNAISRVAVYNNARFIDWGINQNINFKYLPKMYTMDIDACAGMQMIEFDGDKNKIDFLKYSITSIPFYLKNKPSTLIIGSGAGKDVLVAYLFNSSDIDAVEINPAMKYIVDEKFADFTDRLYSRKELGINFILRDGRSFVRETKKIYDIIQLSLVDTWAASSSGALSLTENTLYTVEAFKDYMNKLSENGYLSVTRFQAEPPNQSLRTLSIYLESAKELGIQNPEKMIYVATSNFYPNRIVATFIFKKKPFLKEEIEGLKKITAELGFTVYYSPDENFNNEFYRFINYSDKNEYYNNYIYDITPSTDDKPFFFYMLKLKNFFKTSDRGFEVFNFKAIFLLFITLIIILFFNLLFIVSPILYKISVKEFFDVSTLPYILYFSSIGVAFMLIEIFLVQKFILYLGHPVYSLSIVICSLLFFSGLGSLTTNNIETNKILKYLIKIFCVIFVLFLFFNFYFFDKIIYLTLSNSLILKYIISYILIGSIGFFLGKLFPCGIKLISENKSDYIQWMWSLNGTASVLGSLLAYIIAMNYGFKKVMITGMIFYLIAFAQIIILGCSGRGRSVKLD